MKKMVQEKEFYLERFTKIIKAFNYIGILNQMHLSCQNKQLLICSLFEAGREMTG